MESQKIKSIIESVLFASGEPVKIAKLSKIIGVSEEEVENALMLLSEDYSKGRGLSLVKIQDTIQLVTSSDNAEFVAQMVKSDIQENLSQAALEVLSIVAYRGPISRAEIEEIRGVNCSFTLRALLIRGLVDRTENVKDSRSYLYNISFDFLKKLGVESVEKLPDWETLSKKEEVAKVESVGEEKYSSLPKGEGGINKV